MGNEDGMFGKNEKKETVLASVILSNYALRQHFFFNLNMVLLPVLVWMRFFFLFRPFQMRVHREVNSRTRPWTMSSLTRTKRKGHDNCARMLFVRIRIGVALLDLRFS